MTETITLTFTNAQPTLVLLPVEPSQAPAEFAQVLVGAKGDPGDTQVIGGVDNLGGFTTDPTFYYIIAST